MRKEKCRNAFLGLIDPHDIIRDNKNENSVCIKCGLLLKRDWSIPPWDGEKWEAVGRVDDPIQLITKWGVQRDPPIYPPIFTKEHGYKKIIWEDA